MRFTDLTCFISLFLIFFFATLSDFHREFLVVPARPLLYVFVGIFIVFSFRLNLTSLAQTLILHIFLMASWFSHQDVLMTTVLAISLSWLLFLTNPFPTIQRIYPILRNTFSVLLAYSSYLYLIREQGGVESVINSGKTFTGVFSGPQQAGLFVIFFFILIFHFEKSLLLKIFLGLSLFILMVLTGSKVGLGTLVLWSVIKMVWSKSVKLKPLIFLLAGSAIGTLASFNLLATLFPRIYALTEEGRLFSGREAVWSEALSRFLNGDASTILFGGGAANGLLKTSNGAAYFSAHNSYLTLVLESGILIIFPIFGLLISRIWRGSVDYPILMSIAIYGFFETSLFQGVNFSWLLLWIAMSESVKVGKTPNYRSVRGTNRPA